MCKPSVAEAYHARHNAHHNSLKALNIGVYRGILRVYWGILGAIMENQMGKKMEKEMEAGII